MASMPWLAKHSVARVSDGLIVGSLVFCIVLLIPVATRTYLRRSRAKPPAGRASFV